MKAVYNFLEKNFYLSFDESERIRLASEEMIVTDVYFISELQPKHSEKRELTIVVKNDNEVSYLHKNLKNTFKNLVIAGDYKLLIEASLSKNNFKYIFYITKRTFSELFIENNNRDRRIPYLENSFIYFYIEGDDEFKNFNDLYLREQRKYNIINLT